MEAEQNTCYVRDIVKKILVSDVDTILGSLQYTVYNTKQYNAYNKMI